ncbi:autotransporter domain-containing protein [Bosea sp. Tri-54]|uniref:autotransporter domain-containing protein n=1 Tax=Bosea sp. Tri-54 TaxID=1867716 RepID=UPI0032BF4E30
MIPHMPAAAGAKVALEPFAGLAYVNLHTDGLTETGGAAALTAAATTPASATRRWACAPRPRSHCRAWT